MERRISNINEQSVGTEADNNSTAQNQQVSQPNANTNVVRCPSCDSENEYSQGFKQNIQPVDNGEWRQICFNICDRCGYAIDVWFWS